MTSISATSNVYNNTEQSQSRQPASNDLSSSSVTTDKNTTDFLITLSSTQNTYTRKTEILGIGAGNWAIVANGTVVKNNPLDNKSSVSGVVVDFTAVQGDKTVYETFLKTGEQGGFSTVFTPPSAETTIITAKLVEENAPVQETISVGVTESLLPLLLIAILLGIAIFIIISSWA